MIDLIKFAALFIGMLMISTGVYQLFREKFLWAITDFIMGAANLWLFFR